MPGGAWLESPHTVSVAAFHAWRPRMSLPTILAIDTATELCSVALLIGERLLERSEAVGQKHSERLLPLVDELVREAGLQLRQIDLFAFGAGPGSFTGLRIACGVVQGFAYGCGRPVVGVGNLRALAATAFARSDANGPLLAALDARMHEVYCAVYRRDDEVSELRAPALERPAALGDIARENGASVVAGNALTIFSEIALDPVVQRLPHIRASAEAIARLARIDASRGLMVSAADAAPLYVRDRVALTIDERRSRATA